MGTNRKLDIPWRKNVLALVGAGYFTVLVVFLLMVWPGEMTPEKAYEVVKGPLMAPWLVDRSLSRRI